jgi:hypothetical protein
MPAYSAHEKELINLILSDPNISTQRIRFKVKTRAFFLSTARHILSQAPFAFGLGKTKRLADISVLESLRRLINSSKP